MDLTLGKFPTLNSIENMRNQETFMGNLQTCTNIESKSRCVLGAVPISQLCLFLRSLLLTSPLNIDLFLITSV